MNREYLFRGIREDNGEWVEGSLLRNEDRCIIVKTNTDFSSDYYHDLTCSLFFDVKPETVGQYTGLKDKHEISIFEGDNIKFNYFYGSLGANLGFEEREHELTGKVVWGNYGWAVEAIKGEHFEGYTGYSPEEGNATILDLMAMNQSAIHEESFEIIGNCYSNPELLKKD